jgi:hypothetical protein
MNLNTLIKALLVTAGLGVLQGASGCGRADSPRLDSETHWLMSCESDLDCGAGSCECGVCTEPCSSSADCSVLGIEGIECVTELGACGALGESTAAAPTAAGSACLLPCADNADCGALGAGAVCESQRCQLPASSFADGVGAAPSASAPVLCDGSEDVRFYWSPSDGGVLDHGVFASSRADGFLVIDGQCRYWTANDTLAPVFSGNARSMLADSARGGRAFYDSVLNAEKGTLFADDLVRSPYAGYAARMRSLFAPGGKIKIWGCNSGIANWEYSDEDAAGNSICDLNAPALYYYWRALNERYMPKPSIAQAFADYFRVSTFGATSGSSTQIKQKGKWNKVPLDGKIAVGGKRRFVGERDVLRLAPDVGTYREYKP